MIPNDLGKTLTPSYVAFTDTERLIGDTALKQMAMNPAYTVYDAKRFIGLQWEETEILCNDKQWPFEVVNEMGKPKVQVRYRGEIISFCAEEISSMVLAKLKETAEDYLGETVTDAVITVPSYFTVPQRHATVDAGIIAGLNVLHVVNAPTAAAIAYGLDLNKGPERNVFIFDLGGGTLDVSVLTIKDGVIEVKANGGDPHLGGRNFDNHLVSYFVQEFEKKHQKDISENKRSLCRLRAACIKAKHTLSFQTHTSIWIDSLFEGIDFLAEITRPCFENINKELFRNMLEPVRKCLQDAELEKDDIHDVVLVGGSTRIPKVQKLLNELFDNQDLINGKQSIHRDEAIAHGAAIYAAIIRGEMDLKLQSRMTAPVVGIDLGTSYSCAGVYQNGEVEIILNDQGNRTTPSYVAFTDTEILVGDSAKNQLAMNSTNTVFDAKRFIGQKWGDAIIEKNREHNWPFQIVNDNGKPKVQVKHQGVIKSFFAEEISSMVLHKMKENTEAYLGKTVTNVVVTVPAYFNSSQRKATKKAAKIAGLNVLRVVSAPTAAAIAYGLDKKEGPERHILIFDLGGGTLDVSILAIEDGCIEVKATNGDTHLGGRDFDNRMVKHLMQEFMQKHKKDISQNWRSLSRLRVACVEAKIALTFRKQTHIWIDSLFEGIDFCTTITRARFEELNMDLFRSTLEPISKCLLDANLAREEIDNVVLVGGSTRIPKIRELLKKVFIKSSFKKSINPDEAVAHGAAILAAVVNGEIDLNLHDVAVLTFGIETTGGVMAAVVKRNTAFPVKIVKCFSGESLLFRKCTTSSEKGAVVIKIFEGERMIAKDNHFLGSFEVGGVTPNAEIDVTFDIDKNGTLTVSASDVHDCTKANKIVISNDKGHLSAEEIQKMIEDAKRYKAEDDKQRDSASAKFSCENYVHSAKNAMERAVNKCNEVVDWLERNQTASKEEYEAKQKEVQSVCSFSI
ncbi:heat shock cognate 71 kDa protein-like isoform X3 [Dysidea avara]